MQPEPHEREKPRRGPSRSTWALLGFLAVAGYFLLTEHRAHFLYYLPFVLLLACPLMHLFHGHGGHGDRQSGRDAQAGEGETSPDVRPRHRHDAEAR